MNADAATTRPDQARPADERCRLVLMLDGPIMTALSDRAPSVLEAALGAGDVASLILSPGELSEADFTTLARPLVSLAQGYGCAVMVETHTRVAGRLGADGVQMGQDPDALEDAVERYRPAMMVGAANVKTRHTALTLGELEPDYIMFGRPGLDTHDDANPKNIALGEWWSEMVEIPCIVMGGRALDSVVPVAATRCDFVALGAAVFEADDAAAAVARANALLDEHAPSLVADG